MASVIRDGPSKPGDPTERVGLDQWARMRLLALFILLVLIGASWLLYTLNEDAAGRREEVSRINQVLADLNEYGLLIVAMETGQRGYLLTSDGTYLDSFVRAQRRLPELTVQLEREILDPEGRARLAHLQVAAREKIDELSNSLSLDQERGRGAALALVRTNKGKALMELVRRDLERLSERVRAEQARAEEQVSELLYQRNLSLAVLIGLALAAIIMIWVLIGRYASAEESAQREHRRAERARAVSLQKSVFLANMSHEIRTPMNAIFGFAQLLGDTVTGERERTYVDAITQSGEVLLGLINDLLDMSKIEAGKLDLSPEPVDLRQMFRTCETLFSRIALDKGLRMEWQVDDALPPSLLLDPLRIRQILINLVGNALKNTQHGSVEVRARAEAHDDASGTLTLLLQVTDTGLGIAQDKLSQIFIPFVQLEGPERAASGAGLGLSIVKRLVDLLGGEIRVESQVQRGSCFSVQLPGVLPGTGVASPPQRRAPVIQRLPPLRVLVVDDVTLNRRLIEALFGGERHQVYSAHNGETGVRLAQRERPDLIFMDLRMPGLDGVEAARRIRSLPELASCRIIAATASTLGEEGETGVFDGYLRKPITRGAIEGLLERLFGCAAAPEGQREEPAGAPIAEVWSAADSQSWRGHRQALEDALQRAASTLSSADLRSLLAAIRTLPERPAFRPLLATGADLESAAALFDVVRIESCLAGLRDDLDMLDARATAPV